MPQPLLTHPAAWLAAAAPLVLFAGLALLGRAIGEWGRDVLIFYAAVLLAFLAGVASAAAAAPPPTLQVALPVTGLLVAFLVLALGGVYALTGLSAAYAALTAVALLRPELFRPELAIPWPLCAIATAALLAVTMRQHL